MPRVIPVPLSLTEREAEIAEQCVAFCLVLAKEGGYPSHRADFPLVALKPQLPGAEEPGGRLDRHESRRIVARAEKCVGKIRGARIRAIRAHLDGGTEPGP